jgi:chorismate dehydratase
MFNCFFYTFVPMNPIRITAISYYNTLPFIYGLTHSGLLSDHELNLDVPSESARKIISKEAEIGLIPVGALPGIANYEVVSNLCIGADKDVKSVLLLANAALPDIRTIYLDTDSLTSVNLVRILAQRYWKIIPEWKSISDLNGKLMEQEGMVLIGDKTFGLSGQYPFCYDLAGEWIKFTGLPFVFAVWISRNPLPKEFEKSFQSALTWGVEHREESIIMAINPHISETELISYLKNDISYNLDEQKKKGMEMFLKFLT